MQSYDVTQKESYLTHLNLLIQKIQKRPKHILDTLQFLTILWVCILLDTPKKESYLSLLGKISSFSLKLDLFFTLAWN